MLHAEIHDDQHVNSILEKFCEIMQFDPEASQYKAYTKNMEKARKAYVERKKEEGISTYISTGRKAHYYRKKQELEAKST